MKKKVLFLLESFAGGGVEKVFIDLINHMDIDKYDITVMSIWDYGVRKKDLRKDIKYKSIFPNIKGISRIFHPFVEKSSGKLLYQLGIRDKYDIEIAFLEGRATKIIGSSANKDSRKLAWVHIDLSNGHWTAKTFKNNLQLEKECYQKFDDLVFVSNSAKEGFLQLFGDDFKDQQFHVKYNPIISEEIIIKGNESLNDITKPTDKLLLVTSGRLVGQKGYERLLKVCYQLNQENFNYELWILGEGWGRPQLEELIQKHQLTNVKLLGFKENPYQYIKQGDLFVCSSVNEGFSLVIAEAMILGLPIIGTNCAGPNELLDFGKYGLLVDNSEEGLYKGLKQLLSNEDLVSYYREKSKKRIPFFDADYCINQIENLLGE
ncbi:glycosyltransferase [Turicibacter bilis]|uniref:glycosyltransferase n=1 Tax=Turicibacter bilis TaxID=2735723 RepID=UPI001BAE8C38|nr:glycosyltransferase [Turicibacter bilis]MBS3203742.1 glycosyltransferase [Turicibacter bilis]UUF11105.1 glycosyltransferase [Turicibacter bilis]